MNTLDVRKSIEVLIDESRGDTLKNLNAIKHIGIDNDKNVVVLIIEIGMMGGEAEYHLKRQLAKVVKLDLKFNGIKISFQETRTFGNIFNANTKFIFITSGKGGVGKSTVACNLGYALTRMGKKVAIMDADVYGASVPKYLEFPCLNPQVNNKNKIVPFFAFGMEFISTEFFADEGQPIVWRGSVLKNMVNNFFYQVAWSKDLDYVLIDIPSGTCDVLLDISNIVPKAEALIITTPEKTAAFISAKIGTALKDKKHNIIGVVENMCDSKIFGIGGGALVSEKLDSEVLIQLPIERPKYHQYLYEANEENGKLFDDLASIISIRE